MYAGRVGQSHVDLPEDPGQRTQLGGCTLSRTTRERRKSLLDQKKNPETVEQFFEFHVVFFPLLLCCVQIKIIKNPFHLMTISFPSAARVNVHVLVKPINMLHPAAEALAARSYIMQ